MPFWAKSAGVSAPSVRPFAREVRLAGSAVANRNWRMEAVWVVAIGQVGGNEKYPGIMASGHGSQEFHASFCHIAVEEDRCSQEPGVSRFACLNTGQELAGLVLLTEDEECQPETGAVRNRVIES